MPFVKMPGLRGKVYVPENQQGSPQKHPCKDCPFRFYNICNQQRLIAGCVLGEMSHLLEVMIQIGIN
jgi:hypothetical protein